MPDEKSITKQVPPSLIQKPEVNLVKSDFDALIQQKGYDVYHDHGVKCPCSSKDGGANQSTCLSCGGSGWFYINRTKTRMVFQSMNVNTKLKEWSEERLGTANITARAEDRVSYMDRITLIDSESEHSQVVFLKKQPDTTKLYGTLRYNPIEFYSVFIYKGTTEKPELLIKDIDFTVNRNQIKLLNINDGDIETPTISVRYKHQAEYTVLDLPRDVMVATIKDECTRKNKDVQFPISAIARRSHYMIDRNDYSNENLFDNSFPVALPSEVDKVFTLRTIIDVDTTYAISYTGSGTPEWTDGIQTINGVSADFVFTDDSVKLVQCYVEEIDKVVADLWTDETIFELDIRNVTTSATELILDNPTLRRLYFGRGSSLTLIQSYIGVEAIEVLDFSETTLTDVNVDLYRGFNLQKFVQPNSNWSTVNFKIDSSIIYGRLNIDNLTIKGGFYLLSNAFIEILSLNPNANWFLCTYFRVEDSPLLGRIDFTNTIGILGVNNSRIRISNIGATQEDMDAMVLALRYSIPNNGATGRILDLLGGAPLSETGAFNLAVIEGYGIEVNI